MSASFKVQSQARSLQLACSKAGLASTRALGLSGLSTEILGHGGATVYKLYNRDVIECIYICAYIDIDIDIDVYIEIDNEIWKNKNNIIWVPENPGDTQKPRKFLNLIFPMKITMCCVFGIPHFRCAYLKRRSNSPVQLKFSRSSTHAA